MASPHDLVLTGVESLKHHRARFGGGALLVLLLALLAFAIALVWGSAPARAQGPADSSTTTVTTTTTTMPTTTTTVPAWGTLDVTLKTDPAYYSGRGNNKPAGLWSDGEKLWVSDVEHREPIYIYDLESGEYERMVYNHPWDIYYSDIWSDGENVWASVGNQSVVQYGDNMPWDRDTFLFGLYHYDQHPWGLWSDGSRMYISTMHRPRKGRENRNYPEIISVGFDDNPDAGELNAWGGTNGWKWRNEVNLRSHGNNDPRGIWSDGETMWVVDQQDAKIYAYDMELFERLPGYDINVLKEAGNNKPAGLWSNDGETLWVADSQDAVIYTYPVPAKARLDSLSFSDIEPLKPFNSGRVDYGQIVVPSGLSSTTVTAEAVADEASVTILPEDADTVMEGHQIALATGENEIEVIVTVDGTSLTYRLMVKRSTHASISDDATLASLSADGVELGTYYAQDGEVVYARETFVPKPDDFSWAGIYWGAVANTVSQVTLRYELSDPTASLSIVPADADASVEGHQVNLTAGATTKVKFELESSDETSEQSYQVELSRNGAGPGARLFTHELRGASDLVLDIWSDGTTMWAVDNEYLHLHAFDMDSKVADPDKDIELGNWRAYYSYHFGYRGHSPQGVWSDGSTLWYVADKSRDLRIVAFDLATNSEIDRSRDLSNGLVWAYGLWSDGTTLWLLQDHRPRGRGSSGNLGWSGATGLYAFDPQTLERLPDKDVMLEDPPDSSMNAIWSDGQTVWAADSSQDKVYAFDLSSGERQAHLDLNLDARNSYPIGLWSDGEVMWVSDFHSGYLDQRWGNNGLFVYAYRLSLNTFLSSLDLGDVDFGGFSRDQVRYSAVVPSGVSAVTVSAAASDSGAVVSVSPADADESTEGHQVSLVSGVNTIEVTVTLEGESRTYTVMVERSVHAVLSGDASLASLSVSGVDVGEFDAARVVYEGLVAEGVSAVTVSAAASDETATVTITPEDADADTKGHQVAVGSDGVVEVTVAVVSSDRQGRSSYVVRLGRDAAAGARWELRDLDPLAGANHGPGGLWSDGETLWVADTDAVGVFAYDLVSKQLDEDRSLRSLHVDLDEAPDASGCWCAGNAQPWGLWSDGSMLWIADSGDALVYAYDLDSGVYDSASNVDLSAVDGITAAGLWSDGSTLWVTDTAAGAVYGFDLATGNRVPSADFASLAGSSPQGLWSNGATMWVADSGADTVFAYDMATKERIAAFDVVLGSGNGDARGIFSDGSTLWVADDGSSSDKVFAYRMHSDALLESLVLSGIDIGFDAGVFDYAVMVPNGVTSTTVTAPGADAVAVVVSPSDDDRATAGHQIALDVGDTTITVKVTVGGVARTYTVVVTRSVHNKLSSDADLKMLDLSDGQYLRGFDPAVFYYKGVVGNSVATIEAQAADDTASITITPGDSDDTTDGHQIPVPDKGTATIVVDVGSSDGTRNLQYRVEVAKDGRHGDRRPTFDINSLDVTDDSARGVTSDGITLWVADAGALRLVAYDLATLTRDSARDIGLHQGVAYRDSNTAPEGIWTDGVTIYVADSAQRRVYAYDLITNERDTTKEISLADLVYASIKGLWSNGTTLWVVDGGFDHTLYAYDLTTKERDSDKDIAPSYSYFPQSFWSDHSTIWVADNWTDAIHAYDAVTHERRASKDINLNKHRNNKPEGIWSNGHTIWVADHQDNKLYAYKITTTPPPETPNTSDNTAETGNTADNTAETDNAAGDTSPQTQTDPTTDDAQQPPEPEEATNAAPSFADGGALTRTVAENAAPGTDVGAPVTAEDDDGDTLTYTLSGTDATSFTIDDTGQLQTTTTFDYETKNIYTVTVAASDGTNTASITVTVMVTDIDEALEITAAPARVDHPENSTATVGVYTASDPENAVISWSLGGTDSGSFTITSSGRLSFNTAPDYETKNTYTVTVAASDGTHTASTTVTVTVTNIDEALEITAGPARVDHPENSTATVGVYTASDPENAVISWSLGGTDSGSFTITSSGRLSFNTAPDYETKNTYTVTVAASDGTNTASTTVTVTVTNIDETGTITFSGDPQAGTALTATLSDPDGSVGSTIWIWESSTSSTGPWTTITTAATDTYTPTEADTGRYLRATATYTDGHGTGKTIQTITTVAVAPAALIATWTPPTTHDGTHFTFRLSFNKPIKLSYKNLRDDILHATSATVQKSKRVTKGSNQHWNVTVKPYNTNDITITLIPNTICGTITSICTYDGETLTNTLTATVRGP